MDVLRTIHSKHIDWLVDILKNLQDGVKKEIPSSILGRKKLSSDELTLHGMRRRDNKAI